MQNWLFQMLTDISLPSQVNPPKSCPSQRGGYTSRSYYRRSGDMGSKSRQDVLVLFVCIFFFSNPLTSNTQQWHLSNSSLVRGPASSASVIDTICARCNRGANRWGWRWRSLPSPPHAGPGRGSFRLTETKIFTLLGGRQAGVAVLSRLLVLTARLSRIAPFSQLSDTQPSCSASAPPLECGQLLAVTSERGGGDGGVGGDAGPHDHQPLPAHFLQSSEVRALVAFGTLSYHHVISTEALSEAYCCNSLCQYYPVLLEELQRTYNLL